MPRYTEDEPEHRDTGGVWCVDCHTPLSDGLVNPKAPAACYGPPCSDWFCRCAACYATASGGQPMTPAPVVVDHEAVMAVGMAEWHLARAGTDVRSASVRDVFHLLTTDELALYFLSKYEWSAGT